jgi:outer membrane immunogenic protein
MAEGVISQRAPKALWSRLSLLRLWASPETNERLAMNRTSVAIAAVISLSLSTGMAVADGMEREHRHHVVHDRCAGPSPFAGVYIGANIGYAGMKATHNFDEGFTPGVGQPGYDPGSTTRTTDSVVGGGQVGYNWQCRALVLGVETDFNFAKFNTTSDVIGWSPVTDSFTQRFSSEVNWFGTMRGRMGLAYENVMVYFTAGLAYANVDKKWSIAVPNVGNAALLGSPLSASFSDSNTTWGWTIGGGIEALMHERFTIRAEGLYVDLRDSDNRHLVANAWGDTANLHFRSEDSFIVGRIGINYKFGDRDHDAPLK